MNFKLYFENESVINCNLYTNEITCNRINSLNELIEMATSNGDSFVCDRDIYYVVTSQSISFSEWLFNTYNDPPELREKKLLLMKFLEKSQEIDNVEYTQALDIISDQSNANPDYNSRIALICMFTSFETEWHVIDIERWARLHRLYLRSSKNIDEFIDEAQVSFLNLYFHDNVKPSLKTLNRSFEIAREEIIEHLGFLNGYHSKFVSFRSNNQGYQQLADSFTADTGIRCGPQSSRESTVKLKAYFKCNLDENNKTIMKELCCELHTKFSVYNANPHKQDRLYFHPGEDNIEDGKVLIYHIGDHA